jgi:hypothetical protein
MKRYAITSRLMQVMLANREALDSLIASLDAHQIQCLAREADAVAQRATWASAYLDFRGASGCGDVGHDEAAKCANSHLKVVRKALGYTYP